MTPKHKTPAPKMACDQGASVSTSACKSNRSSKFRQHFKGIIVSLAVRGFLPIAWAEFLIAWGGMQHD